MRPRSATDWRSWWAAGGEQGLRALLREAWPPVATADEATCAHMATRLSTLLGSRAPLRAVVAELGRMRSDLGVQPDAAEDERAAAIVQEWFPAGSVGAR
jgi:hypothetical protein